MNNKEQRKEIFGDCYHKLKTLAILTANNPLGKNLSQKEMDKMHANMKRYFSYLHFQNMTLDDTSFVVNNIPLEVCIEFSANYGQKSFIFIKNNWSREEVIEADEPEDMDINTTCSIQYWRTKATVSGENNRVSTKSFKRNGKSGIINNSKEFDEFIDKYKDYKFSIYNEIYGKNYDDIYYIHDLDVHNESYKANRTAMYSSLLRHQAYTRYLDLAANRDISDRRNTYSGSRMLEYGIRHNNENELFSDCRLIKGRELGPEDRKKGGIIVLPSELMNKVDHFEDKLISQMTQCSDAIDKALMGWTIGRYLHGKYTSHSGITYDENSLSLEAIGVDVDTLVEMVVYVCCEFTDKGVLIKDYSTEQVIEYQV